MQLCSVAFSELMAGGSRIVNIGSGGAPGFVKSCAPDKQAFFCDPSATCEDIRAWMDAYIAKSGEPERYASNGYVGPEEALFLYEYGCSKALATMVSRDWVRSRPDLVCSVCSHGFIETDLTASMQSPNKLPAELAV